MLKCLIKSIQATACRKGLHIVRTFFRLSLAMDYNL
jgi:hypothetical protein